MRDEIEIALPRPGAERHADGIGIPEGQRDNDADDERQDRAEAERQDSEQPGFARLHDIDLEGCRHDREVNWLGDTSAKGMREAAGLMVIPGSVGFPLPGVEIRIAEPQTGKALPQGEVGVIDIRGPNVFNGYWRMPEKTNEEFRADGFFVSGDLGYVDAKGYIYISGRAKDLVISGGYNVYPAEVEAAIEAVPGVAECAVIGVPHADFGEAVVAIVAPKPGTKIDEKQIQAAIAGDLAKYKQPKRVFVTSDIPRNTMGKIQKKDLREAYRGTFGGPQARP